MCREGLVITTICFITFGLVSIGTLLILSYFNVMDWDYCGIGIACVVGSYFIFSFIVFIVDRLRKKHDSYSDNVIREDIGLFNNYRYIIKKNMIL